MQFAIKALWQRNWLPQRKVLKKPAEDTEYQATTTVPKRKWVL
jgi:hypothetical protein